MKVEFTEKELNELFGQLGKIPYVYSVGVISWLSKKLNQKSDDQKRSNPGRKTEKENVSTNRENVYPEKG